MPPNSNHVDRSKDESEVPSQVASDASSAHPITLDLTLTFEPESSQNNIISNNAVQEEEPSDKSPSQSSRMFSCNYCRRKFYSSQALGGHQNAHKRERTLAKRAMRMGIFSARYASLASLPLHGLAFNRSLGIEAHSSVHHHQQSLVQNNERAHAVRPGGARFLEQGPYYGLLPQEFSWPGSFRQVDDVRGNVDDVQETVGDSSVIDLNLKL